MSASPNGVFLEFRRFDILLMITTVLTLLYSRYGYINGQNFKMFVVSHYLRCPCTEFGCIFTMI